MSDKSWKAFERRIAAAFDGTRPWANSGARLDCEDSPYAVVQCKEVQRISLESVTALVEEMEAEATKARKLLGIVALKVRRGSGRRSEPVIAMSLASWERLRLMIREYALFGAGANWANLLRRQMNALTPEKESPPCPQPQPSPP